MPLLFAYGVFLQKFLYNANGVDPDQTPECGVVSGSALFNEAYKIQMGQLASLRFY